MMPDPDPSLDTLQLEEGLRPKQALLSLTALATCFVVIWILFGRHVRGDEAALVASIILAGFLLTLSYIDLRTYLLPDVLTAPLLAVGLLWSASFGEGLVGSAVAALIGFSFIAGLGALWRRLRGYEGIGLGDAKLLGAGLAWMNVKVLPIVLLTASGFGLMVVFGVAFLKRLAGQTKILPFGPFIALGLWFCWCTSYFS